MSTKLEIRNERINQVLFYGGLVGFAISIIAMAIDKDVFGQTMALDDKNTDMQVWTELKKQAEPLRIALSEAINCYPDTKCDLIFAGHGFIQMSYADGHEDSYTENFIGMGQAQDIVNNFVKTYGWLDKDTDSDIYLNIDYDADNQKASDNKNNDNDNKNSASNDNDDNDSKDDNDNNDSYPECEGFTGEGICHDSSDEGPAEGTTTQDNDNEDNDVKDSDNQENQDSEDNKDDSETEQEDNEVEQEDNDSEESENNSEVSEEQ